MKSKRKQQQQQHNLKLVKNLLDYAISRIDNTHYCIFLRAKQLIKLKLTGLWTPRWLFKRRSFQTKKEIKSYKSQ